MKTSSDYLFLAFLILCALGIIDALACAPMPGPIASAPSAGLDPAPTDCADLPLEVALCDATNTPPWIDQPIPVRLDLDISWRPALQRAIAYWERASAFRFTIVADPSVPAVVIRSADDLEQGLINDRGLFGFAHGEVDQTDCKMRGVGKVVVSRHLEQWPDAALFLAHELGHVLGFRHALNGSLMTPGLGAIRCEM